MATAENEKGDVTAENEGEAWGTLEELLLACAVSRHGTNSWDSIAMEVQKRATFRNGNRQRSNDGNEKQNRSLKAFTPNNCEQRYHVLKRRFNVAGGGRENDRPAGDDRAGKDDDEDTVDGGGELLMVDELRKLRVEELRREVERHDVSIVSLQLKVKRLEEERERSSLKAEPPDDEADLGGRANRSGAGGERRGGEPDGFSAEVADKSVSGERSNEPEDRSFNESNSSNRRREPDENRKNEPYPVRTLAESEPARDCSTSRDGGGCGLEEEEKVVGRTSHPGRPCNSGELRGSVSDSKRQGKESEAKQSSDVQSSASLSRRKRRGWRRSDGLGSSGDEMEAEELSPANKRMDAKSRPLAKFLEILRSHKHGLVFQRRLPSQETEKYGNLIRQHMDLETVQSKLRRGVYSDCHPEFYRDILLIFTNAVLFFCKSCTEHMAARELRKLVTKQISAQRAAAQKPKPATLVKPDLEPQILDPVVKKPRSSSNIVVCRRRTSSSAMKPSSFSSERNKSKSKSKQEEVENGSSRTKSNADQQKKGNNAKKLKRERSSLGGRSPIAAAVAATTVNNNSGGSSKKSKGSVQQGESNNSNIASNESSDEEEQPINKRRKQLASRKEGVVNFLKRMKQNSPSKEMAAKPNDAEEDGVEISKKKAVVGKKREGNVGGGKDDGAAKKRASGRKPTRGEEVGRSPKRAGGRPPARKAAMGGGGTPDSGRLKGRRDGEEVGASGRSSSAKKGRR